MPNALDVLKVLFALMLGVEHVIRSVAESLSMTVERLRDLAFEALTPRGIG